MTKNSDLMSKYVPYLFTGLVLAVVLYVRIRLLAVPLERDEGEFAYMGQLLLKGIPPFSHAYSMKLPGVSILYAFFMFLFGQTPAGIHAGLLIVNGAGTYLVYLLTRRLFDHTTALFSCAIYAVLTLSNGVNGLSAHATHFVVLFALAGFQLLLLSLEKRRNLLLLAGGLCFGTAFTMKQHAAALLFFAVLYYVRHVRKNSPFDKKGVLTGGFLFLLGLAIPYALIVLWMVKTGSFAGFWFWTVQYASKYASTPSLASLMLGGTNLLDSLRGILKSQFPFWILAGFGCYVLGMKKNYCTDRFFVFGLLLCSFLATCPGLFFRGHYFVLFLPAVAILAGAGIRSLGALLPPESPGLLRRYLPAVLLAAAMVYSFHQGKESFFAQNPLEVSRAVYGINPFPEAQQIAHYLKTNTIPSDQIAVLGSEPEIYFYADRLSATGHIYMYGLMENQPYAEHMQLQMIREIEGAEPKYVVIVNVYDSWLVKGFSIKSLLDWAAQYVQTQYDQVGVIDIIDLKTTHYLWGDKAAGYTPLSGAYVTVYKRKGGR